MFCPIAGQCFPMLIVAKLPVAMRSTRQLGIPRYRTIPVR